MEINPGVEFQQRPEIEYPDDYDPSLNGIGGWLVLVIIGQILGIIVGLKSIFDNIAKIPLVNDSEPTLGAIFTAGIILLVFEIICSVLILVFIFSRNIRFRILYVIETSLGFVYLLISVLYINSLGYDIGTPQLIGSIIGSVIWIAYLYKSKRIKNTFIYPKLYPYPEYENLKY